MALTSHDRSHLRSHSHYTLLEILSQLSSVSTASTQPLNKIHDNGNGRMGRENQEREPVCSEFVGFDSMDPKDPVSQKEIQEVHETIEGVGDKGKDFSADKMVLDDLLGLMEIEETSTQANDLNMEQMLMDELELVVKGTEDPVCDNGIIPLNSGLGEKQNNGSDVELMDYDANTSGNASKLQVPGELNQQASALVISASSSKHDSQQKEPEPVKSVSAVVGSLTTTEKGEVEMEEQYGKKVDEAMHISLDLDMDSEALNKSEDGGLLNSSIMKDKPEMWNEGEKLEKLNSMNSATNSSNNLIENGDLEEGEIPGDLAMDGNSCDMSSADVLNLEQMKVDEVQKTENAIGNMAYQCKIGHGVKEGGYQSDSFMVNALQDANNRGLVEPRISNGQGITCGPEVTISGEIIECDKAGECSSALKPGNSKNRHTGSKVVNDMPTILTQNKVLHRGVWEEITTNGHGSSSPLQQMVYTRRKRKHGPGSEEEKDEMKQMVDASKKKKRGGHGSKKRKDRTKQMVDAGTKNDKTKMVEANKKKKRGRGSDKKKDETKMNHPNQRAEKNGESGFKRSKFPPVEKPKTPQYCRHFLQGKCYEGDKCKFSHDTVPATKSMPCHFHARRICMKGEGCPFDHQLFKYPCHNFVSSGSCDRGDACLFSHQVPTNQVTHMPSNVYKPELKSPLLSVNTNFKQPLSMHGCGSVPSNVSKPQLKAPLLSGNATFRSPLNNHVCSSVQQNHLTNSRGIHSHINTEHKVTDTLQKQPTPTPTPPPKGLRFLNVAKLSPSPSTLKQDMATPNKENLVQNGTCASQSTSGTTPNMVEIPKKSPTVTPKGINFLSFGKGPVSSFKSSISSNVNGENSILSQLLNLGLPKWASSSLKKDDSSNVSDRTKQNVPLTDPFSNEILGKNQSVAEGMKPKSTGKASTDDSTRDHSHRESVQDGKKANDNSQTASLTSAFLPFHPFVSR